MGTKIINEEITSNNYKEFVEKIVNIFRLANYDKYIILGLKIEKNECNISLSIFNSSGDRQEYDDIKMECDEKYFYVFLKYLVSQLRENSSVKKEDIVNLDDDNFVAYRLITEHNDLVTVNGLTESQAKELISE